MGVRVVRVAWTGTPKHAQAHLGKWVAEVKRLLSKIGIYWDFDSRIPFMWFGWWLFTWDRDGIIPNVRFRPGE